MRRTKCNQGHRLSPPVGEVFDPPVGDPPAGEAPGWSPCGRGPLSRRRRRSAGFTLMELLMVVLIISVLAALVAPKIIGRAKEARVAAAKQQIQNLETALDLYYLDNDTYPTGEQGLEALLTEPASDPLPTNWKGPYLKKGVPLDPWKNEYVYTAPGEHNPDGVDLLCYGPDGKEGGGDDIANYDIEGN